MIHSLMDTVLVVDCSKKQYLLLLIRNNSSNSPAEDVGRFVAKNFSAMFDFDSLTMLSFHSHSKDYYYYLHHRDVHF